MRWRRGTQVLWRTAPGYLVLATVDGRTVEVGGAGAEVWVRLAEWTTEEHLTATLARAYETEPRIVSPDVRSLLHELHAQGYVDRSD